MPKIKLNVRLSQNFDEGAIAEQFLDTLNDGEITVDESSYEVLSTEIVGTPEFDTEGCEGHGTISFTVLVETNKVEGKFVSNSEVADEYISQIDQTFESDGNGDFEVEVEEA